MLWDSAKKKIRDVGDYQMQIEKDNLQMSTRYELEEDFNRQSTDVQWI